MNIDKVLQRVARIDGEIETLNERIVTKQAERQALIDQARGALDALFPRSNKGVGRGNHTTPRGPEKGTPNHKQRSLTPKQVREIRAKWATGEFSQRELGEQYGGLPQPVISSIVHRKTYADVV